MKDWSDVSEQIFSRSFSLTADCDFYTRDRISRGAFQDPNCIAINLRDVYF